VSDKKGRVSIYDNIEFISFEALEDRFDDERQLFRKAGGN
jgi:hypothetical protein